MENPELLKRMAMLYYNMKMGLDDEMFLPPVDQQIIVLFVSSLEIEIDQLKTDNLVLIKEVAEPQRIIHEMEAERNHKEISNDK